ncbi:hypothetical protein PT974_09982 [Cladobotryum mycophilum]|uniref:Apple domain-containing protein n=1 Tax=Cladobotryum mycophilum TaxID=491253 RepID=A0ABR0S8K9_9HYPO
MHPISVPVFYLGVAALLPLQWGAVAAASKPPVTLEVCLTSRTTTSLKGAIPTYNSLRTFVFKRDVYVTKTPCKTITPPAVTKTKTITKTITTESDVPKKTDTYTDTDTVTKTITNNVPTFTVTITGDPVTISSTSTAPGATTVPAPSGFQPVLDTLPGSAAKKKRSANNARSPMGSSLQVAARALANSHQPLCPPANKKPPPSYPAAVTCYGVVEKFADRTITQTAHKTTTVTAPTPTKTITKTKTITVTNVVTTPHASKTVTVTETDTDTITNAPTTTITTTSTSTITVPTYTATAYAVCDPGNSAGAVNGNGLVSIYQDGGIGNVNAAFTADASVAACCNSCAANPVCAAYAYLGTLMPGVQCFNFLPFQATCSYGDYLLGVDYNPSIAPDNGYFVGNGNCGEFEGSTEV